MPDCILHPLSILPQLRMVDNKNCFRKLKEAVCFELRILTTVFSSQYWKLSMVEVILFLIAAYTSTYRKTDMEEIPISTFQLTRIS